MSYRYLTVAPLLLSNCRLISAGDEPVSVTQQEYWKRQRDCAKCEWIGCNSSGFFTFGGHLECGKYEENALNSCFCREDLHQDAAKYISSRVYMACGDNDHDATSAENVYLKYCESAERAVLSPSETESAPPDSNPDSRMRTVTAVSSGARRSGGLALGMSRVTFNRYASSGPDERRRHGLP